MGKQSFSATEGKAVMLQQKTNLRVVHLLKKNAQQKGIQSVEKRDCATDGFCGSEERTVAVWGAGSGSAQN